MTLLGRILNAGIESPTMPISSDGILKFIGGDLTSSSVQVTEEKASGLPTVFRAVSLIAGTIASLPLAVYRSDGEERVKVTTGRAAALVAAPHADLTPYEFWETAVAHMLLWGNAYLRKILGPSGGVVGFDIIHPSRVKVFRSKSTGMKMFVLDGDESDIVTEDKILHMPALGYDGVCGCSPIRVARESFGLALAAEQFGAKMFGSGLLATGVLQTEQRLNEEQATRLSAVWDSKTSGLANSHKTVVLDSGAKFQQLSLPPEDAQFLESRAFQVSEIARMFGVPSHMVMDTEKSTSWGTGIEQMSIGFVVYTLRPWITRVEQRLTTVTAPNAAYARFNVEGLLRGDSEQRSAFYRTLWELGALSTNEIRALEERGPVEGGEVRYRPLNMGVLGTADSTSVPEPTPAA